MEISVIVPVYKVENCLARCVDSLLTQSFRDFRLILVDDGSPDRCPRMCDEYARQDSRVHVIHQSNGGLSAARNAGIDWALARGDCRWLTFVDSDDWVAPCFLEVLRKAAVSTAADVSICGYEVTEGENPVLLPEQPEVQTVTPEEFYLEHRVNATVAWGKLYAAECFRSIRYPAGKIHEDEYVTYRILFDRERLAFVPAPMYAYFYNPQGLTKSRWNPRRLDVCGAYEEQIDFFTRRNNTALVEQCVQNYLYAVYEQVQSIESGYPAEKRYLCARGRKLLRKADRMGLVDFDRDFSMLKKFFPVRTLARMYWQAAMRRLRRQ